MSFQLRLAKKACTATLHFFLFTFLVVGNKEILEGIASVSLTSNPRKENVETTGPNDLIKSNKSNNVIPTRMYMYIIISCSS